MEADPEYHPYYNTTPNPDEQKRRAARQLARLDHLKLLPANINQLSYKHKVFINSSKFWYFGTEQKSKQNSYPLVTIAMGNFDPVENLTQFPRIFLKLQIGSICCQYSVVP